MLRNVTGLRGTFAVTTSRFETTRLTFEANRTLSQGDVRVTYVPERTAKATLEVTVDVPEGVTVVGRQYLGRALTELLENATEFGESPVTVRATPGDTTVDIAVSDAGEGVPEREQAVIAGGLSISQLDHSRGLGLWVVSYVAESLGGRRLTRG